MSESKRRPAGLTLATGAIYLVFVVVLGSKIARVASPPAELIVALAALALLGALRLVYRALRVGRRGPGPDIQTGEALEVRGQAAERVRTAAVTRTESGGGGVIRRWALLLPILFHASVALVFISGLLNVTRHAEGRWVQFAGSGKDLDQLETYQEVDFGLFVDPSELRYGVVLGEIRPAEPENLYDLRIVGEAGVVHEGPMAVRQPLSLAELTLYQWAVGPGVHLTVLHEKQGKLFDRPLMLWPSLVRPGTFEENLATDDLELQVRVSDWPPAAEEPPRIEVALRKVEESGVRDLLQERLIEPKSVSKGDDGYAVIVWEVRPYLGLGLVRGTYRSLTLTGMAGLLLGLLGWLVLRPGPFRYEEIEGGVRVWPQSAGARLTKGGGG